MSNPVAGRSLFASTPLPEMTALPFFFSFPVSPLPIRATSPAVRKHQRISRRKCAEELDSENITLDADALRSHVRLWLRTLTTLVQGHTGSPTPTLHKWLKKEYPITEKAPSSCKPACPFSLSVELNIVGQSPTVLEIRPVHVMGDARRDRTPYVCSPDVMRYSAGSVVPSLCRHLPLVSDPSPRHACTVGPTRGPIRHP